MGMKSKAALALLALAMICSPAIGQGAAQNPPPGQQGQQVPPTGPVGRGFTRPGPDGRRGPDGQQGQQRGFGRGPAGKMGGRFGQRGFQGGPMGRRFGQRGRMGMGGWGMRRGMGRGMGRQGFGGGFGRAGFLNNEALRQRLGITPAQVAKIRQQASDFQKSQIRDRADLQVKRIELNELLAADNPNRAAIDAKLQEVSAAEMASEKAAIDNRLALRDILTPAQRQQIQQMRENGFQPGGPAQAAPGAGRAGRGPGAGQRGAGAPPPNPQGQAPAKQ